MTERTQLRKKTKYDNIKKIINKNPTIQDITLGIQENNYEILKYISINNLRNSKYLSELSKLSGKKVDEIMNIFSYIKIGEMVFNVADIADESNSTKEIDVLYDVSSSMKTSGYINFHRKMGDIFKRLVLDGINIRIFYFSNDNISSQPPITVEEFCSNENIPGGCTKLGKAWNQIINSRGSLLLVTDGQFHDNPRDFNELKFINNIVLATTGWSTIGTEGIQAVRDSLGNKPKHYISNCETSNSDLFYNELKYGCRVVNIPEGYSRFGDIIIPTILLKPTVLSKVLNNIIEKQHKYIVNIFTNFKEIFTRVLCTMKVDFEGCLKRDDSKNLLQIVNIFKKISLRELNKEDIIDEKYMNYFFELNEITKKIFDYGSNQKDILIKKYFNLGRVSNIKEINNIWDTCFNSNECEDILNSHQYHKQTHTLKFNFEIDYESSKDIMKSIHAPEIKILHYMFLYFSNGNLEILEGIHEGNGCIPVWNNDIVDTIRLIPSNNYFNSKNKNISFTFSVTVVYRILIWLFSEMIGPNHEIYNPMFKEMVYRAVKNIPKYILENITNVDPFDDSHENGSISWMKTLLKIHSEINLSEDIYKNIMKRYIATNMYTFIKNTC